MSTGIGNEGLLKCRVVEYMTLLMMSCPHEDLMGPTGVHEGSESQS